MTLFAAPVTDKQNHPAVFSIADSRPVRTHIITENIIGDHLEIVHIVFFTLSGKCKVERAFPVVQEHRAGADRIFRLPVHRSRRKLRTHHGIRVRAYKGRQRPVIIVYRPSRSGPVDRRHTVGIYTENASGSRIDTVVFRVFRPQGAPVCSHHALLRTADHRYAQTSGSKEISSIHQDAALRILRSLLVHSLDPVVKIHLQLHIRGSHISHRIPGIERPAIKW